MKQLRRFLERFEGRPESPAEASAPAAPAAPVVAAAIVLEPDGARTPLGQAIMEAKTFRRLGALTSMVAAAAADGQLDRKMAETLDKLVRTRASILKQERAEQAVARVRALEILTAEEVALLAEYRAKLAGPPLQPGEYPPPPPDVLPPDEEEPAAAASPAPVPA